MDRFDEIVDHYSISLPIVTEKIPRLRNIGGKILLLIFIIFLWGALKISMNPDIEPYNWIRDVAAISFALLILLSTSIKLFTSPHIYSGNVIVSMRHVKIERADLTIDIPLQEIQNITFTNGGYEGQSYYRYMDMASFYEGDDNYIAFMHQDKQYRFRVFVESKQIQQFLKRWTEHCKKLGIVTSVSDQDVFFKDI